MGRVHAEPSLGVWAEKFAARIQARLDISVCTAKANFYWGCDLDSANDGNITPPTRGTKGCEITRSHKMAAL